MRKMSTLFIILYPERSLLDEVRPENSWIHDAGVLPTRKFDGSACMILNSTLYKRWDNKKGKVPPIGAIECQEPDVITGHHPYWILCDKYNNADKYFFEALNALANKLEGK